VITYRATLDVPAETAYQVARWLSAYRNTHDTRPWQRVATPFVQAVMALRWFKEATDVPILARDARVSIATAYRYLHEAIDVIADQAPDLPDVLADGLRHGWAFVCLDGTLIPCTRVSAARTHALPALYPAATTGLPTLTDKGYAGAGIGIHVPTKGNNLAPDNQTRNRTINALRAPAERANALLKRTWKALERVTLDPWRIGAITTAALVLLQLQKPTR